MLNATVQSNSLLKIVERLKNDGKQKSNRVVGSVNAKRYTQLSTVKVCACGCGDVFTTANTRKKYLDASHKQRAYRQRKQVAPVVTCEYCGSDISHKRAGSKFCNASHRRMAHRQNKNELIMSLVNHGVSVNTVLDAYDMHGISALRQAVSMI